ncbi:hypothetical protein [Rhodococcus sp. BS-15]|uniref:DUF3846 domain-containing protein n=1 Tax=Rhodococcus sp. BS-15 TaxID=1304954 RepID=UPI000AC67905|nr:hypothetical protein [Rhodococcus sp. BS-15]
MTQTIRAAIVQPDGQLSIEDIDPQYPAFNRRFFGGGSFEALRTSSDSGQEVTFWCDEEGKFKGLAPNDESHGPLQAVVGA